MQHMLISIQFPSRTTNRWSVVIQDIKDMTDASKCKKLRVTCQLSARSAPAQGSLYTANIHACFLAHPLSIPQLSNTRAAKFFPPLGKEEETKGLHPKGVRTAENRARHDRKGAGERTARSHVRGLLAGMLAAEERRIAELREV